MRTVTLDLPGGERRFLLHGERAGGSPRPLVVMLHGTGGSAEFAADETPWAAAADEFGFLVAFPDGLPPDPARPPSFLSNPKRWNDGADKGNGSLPDDVAFLAAVIARAVDHAGADPTRVLLTGFSNGAAMAFRFAAERPTELAAVAPVAGYCHVSPAAVVPPVPTLYLIGDADKLLPLHGGPVRSPWGNRVLERPAIADSLAKWAAAIGCEPTPQLVGEVNGVREERFAGPVDFTRLTVAGLGHHWPGGKGQFNHKIAGPPSDTLDGCRRVWGWFAGNKRG